MRERERAQDVGHGLFGSIPHRTGLPVQGAGVPFHPAVVVVGATIGVDRRGRRGLEALALFEIVEGLEGRFELGLFNLQLMPLERAEILAALELVRYVAGELIRRVAGL